MNNYFKLILSILLLPALTYSNVDQFCKAPPSTHARILCKKRKKNNIKQIIQDEISDALKPKRESVALPPLKEKKVNKIVRKQPKPTPQEQFVYKPYTPGAFSTPKKEK